MFSNPFYLLLKQRIILYAEGCTCEKKRRGKKLAYGIARMEKLVQRRRVADNIFQVLFFLSFAYWTISTKEKYRFILFLFFLICWYFRNKFNFYTLVYR